MMAAGLSLAWEKPNLGHRSAMLRGRQLAAHLLFPSLFWQGSAATVYLSVLSPDCGV